MPGEGSECLTRFLPYFTVSVIVRLGPKTNTAQCTWQRCEMAHKDFPGRICCWNLVNVRAVAANNEGDLEISKKGRVQLYRFYCFTVCWLHNGPILLLEWAFHTNFHSALEGPIVRLKEVP